MLTTSSDKPQNQNMHGMPIRWAYYCIFRAANAPDLGITASKSYSPHHDLRFDTKTFMELRNAQSVTIAYDGTNPMPPMFCYLKPYYNNVNKSYFRQLADGEL